MKPGLLIIWLLFSSVGLIGKPGAISVIILDERGYPAKDVTIQLIESGLIKNNIKIYSYKGAYLIKPVLAGRYNVKASLDGIEMQS